MLNGEDYLHDAISSALGQNYTNFEVIVGINPSSDRTLEIARSFEGDKRLRVVAFDESVNMPENFNRTGLLAGGELLKFLCHDDILETNCLNDLVEVFLKSNGVTFAVGYESFINSDRRNRGLESFGGQEIVKGKRVIRRILKYSNWIGGPSLVLFERSLLEARPFEATLECSFDLDYWVYLASKGSMGVSKQIVLSSRVHINQGTNKCLNGGFQKDNQEILLRIGEMKGAGFLNRTFAVLKSKFIHVYEI